MSDLSFHNQTVLSSLLLAMLGVLVAGSIYRIRLPLLWLLREKWRQLSCFLLFGWIFLPLYSLYLLLYKLPKQFLNSDREARKNSLRKMKDLFFFITFNIILNGSDVILDGLTAWRFSSYNQPGLAGLTILWVFTPFLYSIPHIMATLSCGKKCITKKTIKDGVENAWIHLPLVIPVINIYHAYELYQTDYSGQKINASQNRIEKIKRVSGKVAFKEAFLESGPQFLTQLSIILLTGQFSSTQLVSMAVSFLSLSFAATRAFFISRDPTHADPEPEVPIMLRVMPHMMVNLLYSSLVWTTVAGLVKQFAFLAILLMLVTNYTALRLWKKQPQGQDVESKEAEGRHVDKIKSEEAEDGGMAGLTGILLTNLAGIMQATAFEITEERSEDDDLEKCQEFEDEATDAKVERKKSYYSAQASTLALWVPCVVGKTNKGEGGFSQIFLVVSISSFICRSLIFIIAVLLGVFKLVPDGAFLLYCYPNDYSGRYMHCYSLEACFNISSNSPVSPQEVRICSAEDAQDWPLLGLAALGLVTGLASLLALWRLNSLTSYWQLWRKSQSLCCLPCPLLSCCLTGLQSPIIHRSLLFDTVRGLPDSEAAHRLQSLLSTAVDSAGVASQSLQGGTALVLAVRRRQAECVEVLLQYGASIVENCRGEHPLDLAVGNPSITFHLLQHGGVPDRQFRQGVQHVVLDHSELQAVLGMVEAREEVRQEIVRRSEKLIPVDNLSLASRVVVEEMVETWNRKHDSDLHVQLGERKIYYDEGDERKVEVRTSDGEASRWGAAPPTHLTLTWHQAGWIRAVQLEYGPGQLGHRHQTGTATLRAEQSGHTSWVGQFVQHLTEPGVDEEEVRGADNLSLQVSDAGQVGQVGQSVDQVEEVRLTGPVVRVETVHSSQTGRLAGLELYTAGGQVVARHAGGGELGLVRREFQQLGSRLGYISCSRGDGTNYQIVFHWVSTERPAYSMVKSVAPHKFTEKNVAHL